MQAAAGFPGPVSVEDFVYEALRSEIVSGRLAAGSALRLREISTEFGVSTLPVRVALSKLTHEGLVVSPARRGATVAPLSWAEFEEIQELRCAIEAVLARAGSQAVDDEGIARMRQLRAEYDRVHEFDEYLDVAWEAYLICYSASGRERSVRLALEYGRMTERYARLAVGGGWDSHGVGAYLDALIDACVRRDPAAAEAAVLGELGEHFARVRGALKALSEQGSVEP